MKSLPTIPMKLKNLILPGLAFAALATLLTNCASLSGFQDARTVGKNNGEFYGSINASATPEYQVFDDTYGADTVQIDGSIPSIVFPNIEIGGKVGVGEKIDLTLRMNTNLNIGLGVKAQILGDRESKFGLGVGAEIGTFGLGLGLWNVQIPVYASVYPTESVAIYVSPRYIYQFSTYDGIDGGLNYLGGNGGLLFGKRHKFGIDAGYYRFGAGDESIGLFQFGIGGKFLIGNN
jgi:hypothetical protein